MQFLDLGAYTAEQPVAIDLDQPSTLPGFSSAGIVFPLGAGVVRGDGPNPELAPLHAESERLAEVLNRLALNQAALDGVAPATARIGGHSVSTPQDLIAALVATGHTVELYDARYFANFGHLHCQRPGCDDAVLGQHADRRPGQQPAVPALLSPTPSTSGPSAGRASTPNISCYFGIDGKAEFRTMDTLDQAWVMGRHAHSTAALRRSR